MAVGQDLARISFLCQKGMNILQSSQVTTTNLDDSDIEGESQITVTPGQKVTILARLSPVTAEIKTLAAGLP